MLRSAFLLFAALAAPPVLACVTSTDLDTGAVLVTEARNYQGEFHERLLYIRRADEGVLAHTFHPQLTNDHWRNLDLGGVLELHSMRTSGALEVVGGYAPEVAALFPLGPNETHVFDGTWTSERGTWTSVYTLETGGEVTAQIGECPYAAVEFSLTDVRTRPNGEVATRVERGQYIPELMLLHVPDSSHHRVIELRHVALFERLYWPFWSL